MILTNDTTTKPKDKKKPPEVTKVGERTKAANFFNDTKITDATRTLLLNSTVLLKANAGHIGSGVILATDTTKAYILTAKHVLYTLSGLKNPGGKKPSDFNNTAFTNTIQIGYTPTALLSAPTVTAPVTGLNFTGSDDQTWLYDIVIFESTDATLRTFVGTNRFISDDEALQTTYQTILAIKGQGKGRGCEALNAKNYDFFQLGYGTGRDQDVKVTKGDGYTDYSGKFQCKISQPTATTPIDGVFEIVADTDAANWPTSNQICMMNADNTNSTGPGDSGGPLFCRLKTDINKYFLVGVTSGANFFFDKAYKQPKAKLPGDDNIHNNVVTYWKAVYDAWTWS
jgi:hypothetical protein